MDIIPLKHETLTTAQVDDIVDLVCNHEDGKHVAMQRYGLRRDQLIDALKDRGIRGRDWYDAR